METSITPTQAPPLFPSQTTSVAPSPTPSLSSDFETFLKMLTVQMENQDPLNPVDSADYAVQLATFSSVEQQVLTNDLLSALGASMAGGGIGALGQWVGMEVRAGDTALYDSKPIELVTPEPDDFDQRILVVRDATGEIATRINIPVSGTNITWDGKLADGSITPSETYKFSIEGFKNGALESTTPATPYNRVREAVVQNGETFLILEGGVSVSPSEVSALRDID
jgi:flagellar basal-body rod modification protein FlgD